MFNKDTIAAISTAVGEGGIGIIRLSGSDAVPIADSLFRAENGRTVKLQPSHSVSYGHIVDAATGSNIDEVLVLVMRAPRSYTREDVVEIHCHGGPLPMKQILDLTLKAGARLAEPGEFTKWAFLNGRIDLSQAEAVIDVIRAKTDASLRMAVGHLEGAFSEKIRSYRHEMLLLIAQLEAAIDFPEEDIEEITVHKVEKAVIEAIAKLEGLLNTAQTGRILREGLNTVIIGKPNVGKSSLLNILLGEKRAIVTDVPGTTRDIIEEYVNIGGIPLKIIDTAGIRQTADVVERIGVEKTREAMARADLILVLLDASTALSAEDKELLRTLDDRQAMVVVNKTDLPSVIDMDEVNRIVKAKPVIRISALDGSGMEVLEQAIIGVVYSGKVRQSESLFVNNVRHVHILEKTKFHLNEVVNTINAGLPLDCIVVDLRAAWEKLGEINGETVDEDIIDQIFTLFCIGK